ncbi:MAG: lipopolysaccharide heptosyltransferase II [Tepidisphaeraceae bacterium]
MPAHRVRPIPKDVRSLLVVLPNWVGDCVMATPVYRVLRSHFTQARITFLHQPYLRELLRGGPWMDQCIAWPPRARGKPWHRAYRDVVGSLKSERFEAAILLPNAFRAALIAWQAGARRRIGYHRDGRGWLLTDRMPVKNRVNGVYQPMPFVEYLADLVAAVGCPRPDDCLELFTTPDCDEAVERRLREHSLANYHPLVLICPGAKFGMSKVWLPERFAAVADRLIETRGAAVVISPGPGEEPLAQAIIAAMRHPAVNLQSPVLNLGELKSLMKRCHLLLGNDTGPRHLARAFNVPIVTVFGPTFAEWTATSYAAERILQIPVDCGPCHKKICPLGHLKCMTGISVDMVFDACADLLPRGGAISRSETVDVSSISSDRMSADR